MSPDDEAKEQAWFDQLTHERIHRRRVDVGRHQQRDGSKSYLDERVNVSRPQAANITDPFIKTIVENRHNQQFYGPAHLGGRVVDNTQAASYEVDVDLPAVTNAILRRQMELGAGVGGPSVSDADIGIMFGTQQDKQRYMHQQGHLPGQPQQQSHNYQQPQQQSATVTLREGYPAYRVLQQAFGNTVILAREVGTTNAQLASQQFVLRRQNVSAYVIPQHQTTVNIQEIQNNPNLLGTFVEVQAPPMSSIGTLLVSAEAVLSQEGSAVHGGRQIITDSRQYNMPQHQQYRPAAPPAQQAQSTNPGRLYGVPVGHRGILRG